MNDMENEKIEDQEEGREESCLIDPVVHVLNLARSKELYSINQYLKHHTQLEFIGYSKLAEQVKEIAIEEMHHADMIANRIKNLLCEPTDFYDFDRIEKHEKPCCIFEFDAEVEKKAIESYNEYLVTCRENMDSISAEIFEKLLKDEQRHFEYFDKVDSLIEELGESYLATQATPYISSIKNMI